MYDEKQILVVTNSAKSLIIKKSLYLLFIGNSLGQGESADEHYESHL